MHGMQLKPVHMVIADSAKDLLHTTTDGSKFPEVIKVKSTTSSAIIGAMKPVFARHGIPETLISDNGPQ